MSRRWGERRKPQPHPAAWGLWRALWRTLWTLWTAWTGEGAGGWRCRAWGTEAKG